MKKKEYERPTIQVVQIQERCHILAGSVTDEVTATMDDTFVEEEI